MVLLLVAAAIVFYLTFKFFKSILFGKNEEEVLNSNDEEWFGKGDKDTADITSIRPFKININQEVLTDLKNRLERTRFEDPLEDSQFQYGFNSKYLRLVVEYWKTQYDWRKQEVELNKYPHFKTRIEGIDVHFIHVKPILPEGKQVAVIPILIVHGWPGSFLEFYKLIPLLTSVTPERNFVFEVICPSIPGYGFSEAPHRKGFNARAAGRVFLTLMERLGHSKFYVQGGDWGSLITSLMAKLYPSRIIGVHLNMFSSRPKSWNFLKSIIVAYFPFLIPSAEYNALYPFKKRFAMLLQESGYFHIQSTKPDTVGCAMSDSPAGLAAYILEKFATWTNRNNLDLQDGGLTQKYTLDELLTNIMIYWVNNNFTSSARFYKENVGALTKQKYEKIPINIPCGLALFPNELIFIPKSLVSGHIKNLISYSVMPRGGHFAAFEEPQLLADDIWQFVGLVQKKRF